MSDVTLDCTCKEGFLSGDWFCSHWFQQTEKAHLCCYLTKTRSRELPNWTGSPCRKHSLPELGSLLWYFMNLYWYLGTSWVRKEITALHHGFHFLGGSSQGHRTQVTTSFPLQLQPLLVRVHSKQGETFPRKQPDSPPSSRCFPHPEAFSALTPTSCTRPSGPGLMSRAQVPWAGSPLLLRAAHRAAWHLLKHL